MNNKIRNIIYLLSSAILALGIFLTIRLGTSVAQDAYYSRVLMNPYTNTINQTIFNFIMCIFGLALGYCFIDTRKLSRAVFMAPLLAATVWMILGYALVVAGIPYNVFTAVGTMIALLAVIVIIKKPKLKEVCIKDLLAVLLMYLSLSLILSVIDVNKFSPDAFDYMIIGTSLAKNGGMLSGAAELYSARFIFTSFLFTPSEFFGFDYENGFYTLYGLSFNLSICSFIYGELSGKLSNKKAFAVSVLSFITLMFASLYSLLAHFYPMSNFVATVYMFMAVFFIYEAKKYNKKALMLSAIFMSGFILSRSESIIIALIIMFFMTNMEFDNKQIMKYELVCFSALLLWYARFFMTVGINFDSGKFLTITRAGAMVTVFILFIIYSIFIKKLKLYSKIKKQLDIAPFAGMILVIAAFMFIDPSKTINNFEKTFENIVIFGEWGLTMIVLVGILSIYYYFSDEYDIWDKTLFSYIIAVIFIFLFRETGLRNGYGDSGNRLLNTIVPIIIYIVSTKLPPILLKDAD